MSLFWDEETIFVVLEKDGAKAHHPDDKIEMSVTYKDLTQDVWCTQVTHALSIEQYSGVKHAFLLFSHIFGSCSTTCIYNESSMKWIYVWLSMRFRILFCRFLCPKIFCTTILHLQCNMHALLCIDSRFRALPKHAFR